MSTDDNFATFRDEASGRYVFVDSFDNKEFNVRLGTLLESRSIGAIIAETSEALNAKLCELVAQKS
jgi:hypothetical protein